MKATEIPKNRQIAKENIGHLITNAGWERNESLSIALLHSAYGRDRGAPERLHARSRTKTLLLRPPNEVSD